MSVCYNLCASDSVVWVLYVCVCIHVCTCAFIIVSWAEGVTG